MYLFFRRSSKRRYLVTFVGWALVWTAQVSCIIFVRLRAFQNVFLGKCFGPKRNASGIQVVGDAILINLQHIYLYCSDWIRFMMLGSKLEYSLLPLDWQRTQLPAVCWNIQFLSFLSTVSSVERFLNSFRINLGNLWAVCSFLPTLVGCYAGILQSRARVWGVPLTTVEGTVRLGIVVILRWHPRKMRLKAVVFVNHCIFMLYAYVRSWW